MGGRATAGSSQILTPVTRAVTNEISGDKNIGSRCAELWNEKRCGPKLINPGNRIFVPHLNISICITNAQIYAHCNQIRKRMEKYKESLSYATFLTS